MKSLTNTYRMMVENRNKAHHSEPITPVVDAEDKTVDNPTDGEIENKPSTTISGEECKARIAARIKALKAQQKHKIIDNA